MSQRITGPWGIRRRAALAVVTALISAACSSGPDSAAPSPRSSAPKLPVLRTGGVASTNTEVKIPPWLRPYPYTTPTPPSSPTPIDGTYLRVLTLREVGGPRIGLPIRCFRCIPFRLDAGVSTLILHRGTYYLHHSISGFQTLGHYEVADNRFAMFNDPNCPTTRGRYRWSRRGTELRFRETEDPCPFGTERADDLTAVPWVLVNACVFRILHLWPGALGC